jgi:hypothetical protein
MAYYTALIAEWATLPAGDTTAQKLAAINALTVTGAIPTLGYFTGAELLNCLNYAEFAALSQAQQTTLLQICAVPGQLLGGSASPFLAPLFEAFYAGKLTGPTIAALTALVETTPQPWWQASVAAGGGGLNGPVGPNDLTEAGGLT